MVDEVAHDLFRARAAAHAVERIEQRLDLTDELRRHVLLRCRGERLIRASALRTCVASSSSSAPRVLRERRGGDRRIDEAVVLEALELAERREARLPIGAVEARALTC